MSASPLSGVRPVFRAVVSTVAPRASTFEEPAWAEAERLVEDALAQRPEAVRRQIRTFLRVVDLLPVLRYGRRFRGLGGERRLRVLNRLERSRLLLLRRGTWGIRTLSFLAVYGQDTVQEAIGYRADPRGWDVRPGAVSASRAGEIPSDHPGGSR